MVKLGKYDLENKIDEMYRNIEGAKQALTTASPDNVPRLQAQVHTCYCIIGGLMFALGLEPFDDKGGINVPPNSTEFYNLILPPLKSIQGNGKRSMSELHGGDPLNLDPYGNRRQYPDGTIEAVNGGEWVIESTPSDPG